jgi:hypothetical protein
MPYRRRTHPGCDRPSFTATRSSAAVRPAVVCEHRGVTERVPRPGAGLLVGRDQEVAMVRAALDAAQAGAPTMTLIVGEAGTGKTRLADEAAVMARTRGMRVLRGEADASRRQPMELWRGVYRSLRFEPFSDLTLPAQERRWDYLESLADALSSCAPVLVVLEGLHWADAIAVWVLDHLPTSPPSWSPSANRRSPPVSSRMPARRARGAWTGASCERTWP